MRLILHGFPSVYAQASAPFRVRLGAVVSRLRGPNRPGIPGVRKHNSTCGILDFDPDPIHGVCEGRLSRSSALRLVLFLVLQTDSRRSDEHRVGDVDGGVGQGGNHVLHVWGCGKPRRSTALFSCLGHERLSAPSNAVYRRGGWAVKNVIGLGDISTFLLGGSGECLTRRATGAGPGGAGPGGGGPGAAAGRFSLRHVAATAPGAGPGRAPPKVLPPPPRTALSFRIAISARYRWQNWKATIKSGHGNRPQDPGQQFP